LYCKASHRTYWKKEVKIKNRRIRSISKVKKDNNNSFFFKSTIYMEYGSSPYLLNSVGFKPTTITAGKGKA